MAGVKVKYYGIISDGFYVGPNLALHLSPSYRPVIGGVWGYDLFTHGLKSHDFKDLRVGLELQAGMDTEGEAYIGLGFTLGLGWEYTSYY